MSERPRLPAASPIITNIFLFVAALGVTGTIIGSVGWWRATTRRVNLDELGLAERQALVEDFLEVAPAVMADAWFDPAIGYTLRQKAEVTAWNDTFVSNELGYRTGPVEKAPQTIRVLFVGDSWTYGMGVSQKESFPAQLQELANQVSGSKLRIESFTLALPGYNLSNELAALEGFFDRLDPDAVVLCPSPTDTSPDLEVLPNGSWRRRLSVPERPFGNDLAATYCTRYVDSFRYREGWRIAFARIRDTAKWLGQSSVPFALFFVDNWDEAIVHHQMTEAGIRCRYTIVPAELGEPQWIARPFGHGTPEAYRHYALTVYQAIAPLLNWKSLDEGVGEIRGPAYDAPPTGDWERQARDIVGARAKARMPEEYEPGKNDPISCAGPMDCRSGIMGRSTTILLRRKAGMNRLAIRVKRVPQARGLYPLTLRITIPSASGGSDAEVVVGRDDSTPSAFELPIPADIDDGVTMDVEIRASRASMSRAAMTLRSVYIAGIEQR